MGTNFFIAVHVLPVELLAHQVSMVSGCKLTKIALIIYFMLNWVESMTPSVLLIVYFTHFSNLNTIDLRCPWTRDFFKPTSRTIDFSLWLKNSNHVITFFVALWFWKYQPCGASPSFFPGPRKGKTGRKVSICFLFPQKRLFLG